MSKDICIEKICNLPLTFKSGDKSSYTLLEESKFAEFHTDISIQDIQAYLSRHQDLIDKWEMWSGDKRTWGYYLVLHADKCFIGSHDKDRKEDFAKTFNTKEEACAEFILREVGAILEINAET